MPPNPAQSIDSRLAYLERSTVRLARAIAPPRAPNLILRAAVAELARLRGNLAAVSRPSAADVARQLDAGDRATIEAVERASTRTPSPSTS